MNDGAGAYLNPAATTARFGLAMFGHDRRLVTYNPLFAELLGLSEASLEPGVPFSDVLKALPVQEAVWADLPDERRSLSAYARYRRADGQVIDLQLDWLPHGGSIITACDTSALVQVEADARRRAGTLDLIMQHIPHGVAVYGPDRRVTLVNPGYRAIMDGAPLEVGDTLEDVIRRRSDSGEYGPGDAHEIFAEQISIDPDRPQVRCRHRPNGTTIDVRTTPLPEGGHMSMVTDVTSLINAESELARRAKTMDAMLANIRHGIVLWDREQRIIACNAVAEQLLLAPPGLLVPGRTLTEVIKSAQDRGNLGVGQVGIDTAVRLGAQDRSKSHQDQRLTQTGRVLEVRTDPTPDGGFVTTYTDVTDIRQAEEALQHARRGAELANTAKSRFLAAMSHELRTPLNAVIASSGLIRRATDGSGPAHIFDAADHAHAAGRQLVSMIDTILDVARLEAGRFDMSEDRVDLFKVIRACVNQSDASAAAAEVSLNVDLPERLPAVRGDERRLRQALHHLLSNAVKFTGAGGQVSISAQRDSINADLMLKVSDTGIGIAEIDLDRVFEPFAYLDAEANRRFPGTGLGLYLSRALMRAHDGELTLRSRAGEGTIGIMRIPAERLLPTGHDLPEDIA